MSDAHVNLLFFRSKATPAGPTNSVSFRQGANVEFEGPSFVNMAGVPSSEVRVGRHQGPSMEPIITHCISRVSTPKSV